MSRRFFPLTVFMVEVLVTVPIVGLLMVVGLQALRPRPSAAIRAVLGEAEAVVRSAQALSLASGNASVYLVADGIWDPAAPNAFVLAYGLMKPADGGSPERTVARLLKWARNPAAAPAGEGPEGAFGLAGQRGARRALGDARRAAICPSGSPWWSTALGAAQDLSSVAPGNTAPFAHAIQGTRNLVRGGEDDGPRVAIVDGVDHRWVEGFHLRVVGLRNGDAAPGGGAGYLVVPARSAAVYTFLNEGRAGGDGRWGRL